MIGRLSSYKRTTERTNHPFLPGDDYGWSVCRTNQTNRPSRCSSARLSNAEPTSGTNSSRTLIGASRLPASVSRDTVEMWTTGSGRFDPGALRDALPTSPTDRPFGRGCRASLRLRRLRFVDAEGWGAAGVNRTTRRLPRELKRVACALRGDRFSYLFSRLKVNNSTFEPFSILNSVGRGSFGSGLPQIFRVSPSML
jgi:hypothetical protein